MSEQNKVVLRRHFAELWSQGNVALDVCAVRTAFPDLLFKVEDVIAEADRVVSPLFTIHQPFEFY